MRTAWFTALTLLTVMLTVAAPAIAQTPWTVEGLVTVSHFQQQVKAEVGDPRGERLVYEYEFGVMASGLYRLLPYLSAGAFARADAGRREAARFDGFAPDGTTQVAGRVGGPYTEFWAGPMLRGHWRRVSLDVGYALIGVRSDDGRPDLPNESGATSGAFSTHPTIAWLVSAGGSIPLIERLDLALRLEYRGRYYHRRGGEPLASNIDHGTQSIAPMVGVSWRP